MKSLITLQKVAKAVSAQHQIEVVFEGTQAYTDGRRIVLPALAPDAPKDLLLDLQGYLDHELAHVLYTDFSSVKLCKNEVHHWLSNHCEDARIERIIGETFPGTKLHLTPLNAKWQKITHEKWTEISLINRVCLGVRSISEGREPRLDNDTKPLFTPQVYNLAKSLQKAKNTADVIDICGRILRLIDQEQAKQEQDKQEADNDKADNDKADNDKADNDKADNDKADNDKADNDKADNDKADNDKADNDKADSSDTSGDESDRSDTNNSDDDNRDNKSDKEKKKRDKKGQDQDREYNGKLKSTAFKEAEKNPDNDKSIDIHSFCDDLLEKHFESEIEKRLEITQTEKEREFNDGRKHVPYSTKYDQVHIYDKKVYPNYPCYQNRLRPLALKLSQELDRILVAQEQKRVLMEQERGHLNRKALARMTLDKNYRTPFKIRVKDEVRDVAVQLVIDLSSSMTEYQKIKVAQSVAIIFAEALLSLDLEFEVGGFHTGYAPYSDVNPDGFFNRVHQSLQHHIFKTFTSRNLSPLAGIMASGANCDGESIRFFGQRLQDHSAKRKIMIVLSDGYPNSDGITSILNSDLRRAVKELAQQKIEVIGIGIMDDAVKHFYPNHVIVQDVNDLTSTCIRKLKGLLSKSL